MKEAGKEKARVRACKAGKKANTSRRRTITELFQNYRGGCCPAETDWGEPRGREIW